MIFQVYPKVKLLKEKIHSYILVLNDTKYYSNWQLYRTELLGDRKYGDSYTWTTILSHRKYWPMG